MMNLQLSVALVALLYSASTVRSDDQNCMNGATKIIPMSVSSDNPNKVMTYARDEPGYVKNLKCKWELRAEDYSKSRQMLLNVTLVDFDTNDATKEECEKSQVDLFNFTFSGQLSPREQVSSVRLCSNNDTKSVSGLMLANLWSSSNYLTVEFRSDDRQVRSDAKGVEMDVFIMAENYCHRSMLYHDGACYLVTGNKLTFSEALANAKPLLGNLATFPTIDSVKVFLAANKERNNMFPYRAPFDFASQKVWIGHFVRRPNIANVSSFMNRYSNCLDQEAPSLPIIFNTDRTCTCGVAMQIFSNSLNFTCESLNTSLPALIEFTQIGTNRHNAFVTCTDVTEECEGPPTVVEPPRWYIIFIGVGRGACVLIIMVVIVVVIKKCLYSSVPTR